MIQYPYVIEARRKKKGYDLFPNLAISRSSQDVAISRVTAL